MNKPLRNPDSGFAPAFAHLLPPRGPTTEQLADDALLMLSKLRDRLVVENANIPACRVDEAMTITLDAARQALGLDRLNALAEQEGRRGPRETASDR